MQKTGSYSGSKPPVGAGRRGRKADRTRRALLAAAMDLFAERGIGVTRVQDITERADVAKGAFYNYFKSKASLVAVLLSQSVRMLEGYYPGRDSMTASSRERISGLLGAHEAFFSSEPSHLMLFHHARGLFMLRGAEEEEVRTVLADYLHRLGALIVPVERQERWGPDELVRLGAFVAGVAAGRRSYAWAAGISPEPDAFRDAVAAGIGSIVDGRASDLG